MEPIVNVAGIEHAFTNTLKLVIPPLTLNAFKQLRQRGVNLGEIGLDDASLDTVIAATHAALVRNYPQMTLEEVGELIDLGNVRDVISSVLDVSGLKRRRLAEGAEGNAQGATTQMPSTGTP